MSRILPEDLRDEGISILTQHFGDGAAFHIRQAEVAALELEGQLGVIDAQGAEDRRVEIVHVDGVADDVVAEVVGLAVSEAGFDAAAG